MLVTHILIAAGTVLLEEPQQQGRAEGRWDESLGGHL
eukprot:COSAG02_NODE_47458_length_341_cov_0.611570_1_plen_36_part_10